MIRKSDHTNAIRPQCYARMTEACHQYVNSAGVTSSLSKSNNHEMKIGESQVRFKGNSPTGNIILFLTEMDEPSLEGCYYIDID
ncbi:hypothetical protein ACFO1V_05595 [Daeguia caeni]|uniref:Uncharacterized protein n=1 Tax=Daeguia caeni TaxID=439612 RepID=A0ABV9H2Q3_9HYPH